MVKKSKPILQPYPRREGDFLADNKLFPRANPISEKNLNKAIRGAFERTITGKKGKKSSPDIPPKQLVDICLKHLKERSDPILSPSFLGQLELSDIFVMDAISHEMQRHRMKIGEFYQYILARLMAS